MTKEGMGDEAMKKSLFYRAKKMPPSAQIMLLFAQGRSANWIAEDLVISKNTVRSHIRSIYTKLDVHSRKELLEKLAQG